jgi:hypothetical protein
VEGPSVELGHVRGWREELSSSWLSAGMYKALIAKMKSIVPECQPSKQVLAEWDGPTAPTGLLHCKDQGIGEDAVDTAIWPAKTDRSTSDRMGWVGGGYSYQIVRAAENQDSRKWK